MGHFKFKLSVIFLLWALNLPAIAQQTLPEKTLDYFIDKGLKASPLLKDYTNQLRIAEIDSLRLVAGLGPQLIASSSAVYAPRIHGYGFDEVITNGQNLDALLTLNYTITGKARRSNQFQAIRLQRDSINYANKLSVLDLQRAIIEQYITAYSSQQQVAFNKEVFKLLSEEEKVLKSLTRSNVYTQVEYLTFSVTFKQQQLSLKQAETQYENDLFSLNYLSGILDTKIVLLTEPLLKDSIALMPINSFFNTRFEIDSLKAVNESKALDLDYYKPKATIYVNGGYNSSLMLQPYKNFGTSLGFTLALPLYDGGQRKMRHDQINLQLETTAQYHRFFSLQQQQQLSQLKQQIVSTTDISQQIRSQIQLIRGLISVDAKLLHTGDVKIADFIIAISNYLSAQNLLKQNNINRWKLIGQLNYWNR